MALTGSAEIRARSVTPLSPPRSARIGSGAPCLRKLAVAAGNGVSIPGWCEAELLRMHGALLRAPGLDDRDAAEVAMRQEANGRELRDQSRPAVRSRIVAPEPAIFSVRSTTALRTASRPRTLRRRETCSRRWHEAAGDYSVYVGLLGF
jgi:hypothetical protein